MLNDNGGGGGGGGISNLILFDPKIIGITSILDILLSEMMSKGEWSRPNLRYRAKTWLKLLSFEVALSSKFDQNWFC